jgi:phosphate transport system permease protein
VGLSLIPRVTLAIMILPLILRATEEALIAVPASTARLLRHGRGQLRTVSKVVLPSRCRASCRA